MCKTTLGLMYASNRRQIILALKSLLYIYLHMCAYVCVYTHMEINFTEKAIFKEKQQHFLHFLSIFCFSCQTHFFKVIISKTSINSNKPAAKDTKLALPTN